MALTQRYFKKPVQGSVNPNACNLYRLDEYGDVFRWSRFRNCWQATSFNTTTAEDLQARGFVEISYEQFIQA